MNDRPLILVTNDDGITAPGIRFLIDFISDFGEVYVCAPDSPQSGMGHAVTINSTLHCDEVFMESKAIREWACSGTPADCVKLAIDQLLPRKPDLCVSGINHGSNSSINILYSGTMSAAVEAGINGITAIGFSLMDFSYNADFDSGRKVLHDLVSDLLKKDLPHGSVFNVNIPAVSGQEIKGYQFCRQADAIWEEEFVKREDPRGRTYYWLTGVFNNKDEGKDTDEHTLSENYISVVPVQFDLTNYKLLQELKA